MTGDVLLLQENLAHIRLVGGMLLEKCGFNHNHIRALTTIREAEMEFKTLTPSLVIVDANAKDGATTHFVYRIRNLHGYTGPIIATTTMAYRDRTPTLLEAGCTEVLYKPFSADQFTQTVLRHLPLLRLA